MPNEFYNEKEAEAILKEASRLAPASGAMSRQKLIETAAELGIPPEAVLEAEQVTRERAAAEALAAEFRAYQRSRFVSKITRPAMIGVIFVVVFLSSEESAVWALIVGAIFLLRALATVPEHLFPRSYGYQAAFTRWKRKQSKE